MIYPIFARSTLVILLSLAIANLAGAQNVGPRPVGQNRNDPAAKAQQGGALAPDWIPLSEEHQKYLDDILNYWEHSTQEIKRYRCQFKRWEYEPKPKTYSEGVIKYAKPDKGLFRVEKIMHARAPKEPGGKLQWSVQKEGAREHWVCDGKSIFEFDYNQERLVERQLPPQMQGQQITHGPLPFMFGAQADRIKQRFWIRVVTPEDSKGEYWLEAVPKTREDAANFRKIKIIIAEEDYLPKGMILFHRNNAQTTFSFAERETNWSVLGKQLNLFHREFFEPATPSGWKKVVEPVQVGGAEAPRQAQQRQSGRGRPR